jgi:ABC-type dipeptide/oligopeptide/nickel transport system permease subunit
MKSALVAASADSANPVGANTQFKPQYHRTLWGDAWIRMRRNRAAVISAVFLLLLVGAAVAAPLLTPFSPEAPDFGATLQHPDAVHPLGTDELGRDMVARLLFGARVSLSVGLVVQIIALGVGTLLGLSAGYFGGTVDMVVMRMVDIMYAFPSFLFAVFMVALLDPSIGSIVLVLSLTGWPFAARLVRGQVLALRDLEYISAARVVGARSWRIMVKHILPNTLGILIVHFTLGIADVIMAEAGLSFLGIGIRPPTPTWGGMIAKSREYFRTFPYLALYPSIALALTVLAFNFLGDGLRDALDPRMRK